MYTLISNKNYCSSPSILFSDLKLTKSNRAPLCSLAPLVAGTCTGETRRGRTDADVEWGKSSRPPQTAPLDTCT